MRKSAEKGSKTSALVSKEEYYRRSDKFLGEKEFRPVGRYTDPNHVPVRMAREMKGEPR